MVFHKDELLSLLQVLKLGFQSFGRIIIILDIRVLIHGITGILPDVGADSGSGKVLILQTSDRISVFPGQHGKELAVYLLKTLPHPPRSAIRSNQNIHDRSEDRQCQDQDHPGHLHGGCDILSVNLQHQNQSQKMQDNLNPCGKAVQGCQQQEDQRYFKRNRENGKNHSLNAVFPLCPALHGLRVSFVCVHFIPSSRL